MSDQEVIDKAIRKAVSNGWQYPFHANCYEFIQVIKSRPFWIAFGIREDYQDEGQHLEGSWQIPELIFNHDFAKALWGELPKRSADMYDCPRDEVGQVNTDNWEHHLQQIVVSDDPIAYLKENI